MYNDYKREEKSSSSKKLYSWCFNGNSLVKMHDVICKLLTKKEEEMCFAFETTIRKYSIMR